MQNYVFKTGFPDTPLSAIGLVGWIKTDSHTPKTIGWTDVCVVVNRIKLTVLFKHSHICESLDE